MDYTTERVMVQPRIISTHFPIFSIPRILYEGLIREYGKGAQESQDGYTLCNLDAEEVGVEVCMGLSEDFPKRAQFCIWSKRPSDSFDFRSTQLLSVTALQTPTAAFFSEKPATRVIERITIRLYSGDFVVLSNPYQTFIHWLWGKTIEVYKSELREPENEFWKSDW